MLPWNIFKLQNKLLDTRFKETVERLEKDRSELEEKVRELQTEVFHVIFLLLLKLNHHLISHILRLFCQLHEN